MVSMSDSGAAKLTIDAIVKNLRLESDRKQCIEISRDAFLSNFLALKVIETEIAERDLILWFGEKMPSEYARTRLAHSVEKMKSLVYDEYVALPVEVEPHSLSANVNEMLHSNREKAIKTFQQVYNVEQERTDLETARLLLEIWMNRVFTERKTLLLTLKNWIWRQMYAKSKALDYFESLMDRVTHYLSHDLQVVLDKVNVVFSLHGRPVKKDAQKRLSDDFDFISKKMVDILMRLSQDLKNYEIPDTKHFIWIRDNCYNPTSSPQLNFLLKKIAGKVLLYANLENYHKNRAIKYFGRAIGGFSGEDVQGAWASLQTITIPSGAEVDFVVSEMLAGEGPVCKRTCVERFINWALDDLKKGSTSKEFVIAVRNQLRR